MKKERIFSSFQLKLLFEVVLITTCVIPFLDRNTGLLIEITTC